MRAWAALLALFLPVAAADLDVALLRAAGVSPAEGPIRVYLRSLVPEDAVERARELVTHLGSADAVERAEVSRRLRRQGTAAIPALTEAALDRDPEVARRARGLLAAMARLPRPGLLYAVFRVVIKRRIGGLGREMVAVLPLCRQPYLRRSAREALVVTASRAEVALLRATVRGKRDPFARSAALHALAAVQGAAGADEIVGWLADRDSQVRCAAAWALAERNDRRCFPAFSALLEAAEEVVRRKTAGALRSISGKQFGYASAASAPDRAPATQRWRRWIRDHAPSASWTVPLQVEGWGDGRLLLSVPGERRLVEIDLMGNLIWEKRGLPNIWPCAGTPSGNRLVGYFDTPAVVEYDAGGRIVWRQDRLPGKPCSLQRLENGNTLVAVGSANRVIEYTPDHTIAWQVSLPGRVFYARRLPNGRTLVALHDKGRVLEITQKKRVIEKFTIKGGPYTVQPLDNGNVLICLPGSGQVVERTPKGKLVWSVKGLGWAATAVRLPGGDTIVAHTNGVDRIAPDGTRKTLLKLDGTAFLSRY